MPPAPSPALQVIGKRLPRVDAKERVTGQAIYPADLALPGMVHAKLLRSPHAHARIVRIDTSRAEALKGVLAVVTAADFAELPVGATIPMGETGYDMWMVAALNIARSKVHWVGQPVAGVAAADVHVAEAASRLSRSTTSCSHPCSTLLLPWRPTPPSCTSTSSPRAWSRGRARRATSARARQSREGTLRARWTVPQPPRG